MVLCYPPHIGFAQGTFQNLDFEMANVPDIPQGQTWSDVLITEGLPGWTGYSYLGTNPIPTVLHNNQSAGAPRIAIWGPQWSPSQILQGQYTVHLQAGIGGFGFMRLPSAIAQT